MKHALVCAGVAAVGCYIGAIVTGYESGTALRAACLGALLTAAVVTVIKVTGR